MGVIKCPSCSADVDDKMLFCPNCFGELKEAKDSSQDKKTSVSNQVVNENSEEKSTENGNFIVCPSCGKKSSKGMLFCPFCFNEFAASSEDKDSSDNIDEDIDLGFDDFLAKPVTEEMLVAEMLAICEELSTWREKKAGREAQEKDNAYLFGRR